MLHKPVNKFAGLSCRDEEMDKHDKKQREKQNIMDDFAKKMEFINRSNQKRRDLSPELKQTMNTMNKNKQFTGRENKF